MCQFIFGFLFSHCIYLEILNIYIHFSFLFLCLFSFISFSLPFIPNLILELIWYKKPQTRTSMFQRDRDTHTNTHSPDSTHRHITAYVLHGWVANLGADMLFPIELVSFQRHCFCLLLNYIHHSFFKAENMTAAVVGRKEWDWCTSFVRLYLRVGSTRPAFYNHEYYAKR